MIYVVGSLRNPEVQVVAARLRDQGFEVFDDWFAAGPEADDWWMHYEKARGHSYREALEGYAANHVFEYDRFHLNRATSGVMVLPAGKSGHLELGYLLGQGKPGYILLNEEPERYDVMVKFAQVVSNLDELMEAIERDGIELPVLGGKHEECKGGICRLTAV